MKHRTMKAVVLLLSLAIPAAALAYETVEDRHVRKTTTIPVNAVACTAPGGASCTIIGPSLNVRDYSRLAITIRNTGANPISSVLVEFSHDGTTWELWDSTTFAGLAAATQLSMQISGNSRGFLRIEGRSAAGTTAVVDVRMGGRELP